MTPSHAIAEADVRQPANGSAEQTAEIRRLCREYLAKGERAPRGTFRYAYRFLRGELQGRDD